LLIFFIIKIIFIIYCIDNYDLKANIINQKWGMGIGVRGLGIGDWAQSPIPNPQSPIIKLFRK
jgi:hypothetical protein